jgi:hypothetical protein
MDAIDRLIALAAPVRMRRGRGNLDLLEPALEAVAAADGLPTDDVRRVAARANLCEVIYHAHGTSGLPKERIPEALWSAGNVAGLLHVYADQGFDGDGAQAAREIGRVCLRIGDYLTLDPREDKPREAAFAYYSYANAFASKWGLKREEAQALYHWASVRVDRTGNARLEEARAILHELAGSPCPQVAEGPAQDRVTPLWRDMVQLLTPLQPRVTAYWSDGAPKVDGMLCAARHLRYWAAESPAFGESVREFVQNVLDHVRSHDDEHQPLLFADVLEGLTVPAK